MTRSLDMRYVGQVRECTVEIGDTEVSEATLPEISEAFHQRHREPYTCSEPHNAVGVVNVESAIHGRIDKPGRGRLTASGGADTAIGARRGLILSADGAAVDSSVHDGARLGSGEQRRPLAEPDANVAVVPGVGRRSRRAHLR